MPLAVALALLLLAGCGDEEREARAPAPTGTLEVVLELPDGPVYIEGSVPVISVDGPEDFEAEATVGTLDEPVLVRDLPRGQYEFAAVHRPCSGTCEHLDPPDAASRCETRFGIAAGEPTRVTMILHGAPGGVAAECAVILID